MPRWRMNNAELNSLLSVYQPSTDNARSSSIQSYGKVPFEYKYGTAGFRYHHKLLPHVFIKMGILATLRSASMNGEAVGIMCTASHNTEDDNGVKIADPDGGMLEDEIWERYAVELANAIGSADAVASIVERVRKEQGLEDDAVRRPATPRVHFGRDTRPHSKFLSFLASTAARLAGAEVFDHGIVATPQLHFFVLHANPERIPSLIPRSHGERGYFDLVVRSYLALLDTAAERSPTRRDRRRRRRRRWSVDCACGVGALKIETIRRGLESIGHPSSSVFVPLNKVGDGPLNESCGAEHVQKNRSPPTVFTKTRPSPNDDDDNGGCWCSLDGDADRIVFHYTSSLSSSKTTPGSFRLLDGDKISVLVTDFVRTELDALKNYLASDGHDAVPLTCGVVQTAYANGASTAYLRDTLHVDVRVAKTGVKYVHAEARSNFDVGIYFEANGHGTILFGDAYYAFLSAAEPRLREGDRSRARSRTRASTAHRRLMLLPSLVNQAVGDALCDLLLVDAILSVKGWDHLERWDRVYEDRPSRQLKVKVRDRSVVVTNENETRVVAPVELQNALDRETEATGTGGRCFVRPSGTEDAVRVYAEVSSSSGQKDADALAARAKDLVEYYCGGVERYAKERVAISRL